MTAEFAIALPCVVLVLAACLSGMQIAGQQLRLHDAAAAAARSVARGDGLEIASRLVPGSVATRSTRGDLECVTVSARSAGAIGGILSLSLHATSCAPGGGK